MTELVRDLLDIPAHVQKSDFVLELTRGVAEPERTADTYVVTEGLKDSFRRSLALIESSLADGRSKATYLHGSFGSGKSHFMAVLSLLIDGHEAVWRIPAFHSLRDGFVHVRGKKLLQLQYHMIGALTLEQKLLSEYVDFTRKHFPDAPLPNVFADEQLFDNARDTIARVGEDKFFADMGGKKEGWGKLATGWTREKFEEHARSNDPELRGKLFEALAKSWFPAIINAGRYVDIDTGLAAMARHAKGLGFDGIVLYLDELILWLSHRASEQGWLHNEVQKMVKLVESQDGARALPIVSFIARQRNLAEMVGKMHTGLENQLLHDSLKHWEGRFDQINLEDRDLPAIVEKRVLRPKSDEAKARLDRAFDELRSSAGKSLETLQGKDDLAAFRKLYPFSPALVSALVALSNSLQRDRTAIRLLMELLVDHIGDLEIGKVVGVGDLFDVLSGGEDPADGVMRARFQSAKDLYRQQLLPVIQDANQTNTESRCQRLRPGHRIGLGCSGCGETQCRLDNRIVKTLLIAALVPEVDELKNLTVSRLYRLNHGMVRSIIPGQEAQIVAGKLKKWAASIAQIHVGQELDPTVWLRLEGVDLKPIMDRYSREDSPGARQRVLREILLEGLGFTAPYEMTTTLKNFEWKGSKRTGVILFGNIRTLNADTLRCPEDHDFRLIIDYPFDDPGKGPHDDAEVIEAFETKGGSWTLAWMPHFFSASITQLLGDLVILGHIRGDRQTEREAVQHLPVDHQSRAIADIHNLYNQKRMRLGDVLEQAYGLKTATAGDIDSGNMVENNLRVLKPGAGILQAKLAANLSTAKDAYISGLLDLRYPRHPEIGSPLTHNRVNMLVEAFADLMMDSEGRKAVDREKKAEIVGTLGALDLVRFSETHILRNDDSRLQPLENKRAQKNLDKPTASEVRSWIDETGKMGLQPDALDLMVRCYAVWANRTLTYDGKFFDANASKGKIPDQVVLDKPDLPSLQEWSAALQVSAECLGITFAGRHLSPDSLSRWQSEIDRKLVDYRQPCSQIAGLLQRRAAQLGLPVQTDRQTTAAHAEDFVLRASIARPTERVSAIASFIPKTSTNAVAASVAKSQSILHLLSDDLVFGPIEQLQKSPKSELQDAREVIDDVARVFRSDEVNEPIESRIRQLAIRAQTILNARDDTAPPPSDTVTPDQIERQIRLFEQQIRSLAARLDGYELVGSLRLEKKP